MGARANGYIADITCTFPINGKFTEKQAQIYNIVLNANRAANEFIKPGSRMFDAQAKSIEVITQGLIDVGIIKADLKTAIEKVNRIPKPFSNCADASSLTPWATTWVSTCTMWANAVIQRSTESSLTSLIQALSCTQTPSSPQECSPPMNQEFTSCH